MTKKFNRRASLMIDRYTAASERGNHIARLLLRLLERLFVPRRMAK